MPSFVTSHLEVASISLPFLCQCRYLCCIQYMQRDCKSIHAGFLSERQVDIAGMVR
ncbi:UNVERIFIED_CONTAM: hypothetical protein FKN15_071092 [Acipenser sinensis]